MIDQSEIKQTLFKVSEELRMVLECGNQSCKTLENLNSVEVKRNSTGGEEIEYNTALDFKVVYWLAQYERDSYDELANNVRDFLTTEKHSIPRTIGDFDGVKLTHTTKKALNAFYTLLDGILKGNIDKYLP